MTSIRSATNADGDQIRTLIAGVLAEFGLKYEADGTDADLKDIEQNYLARGGVFDVVLDDESNIIGTVGLYPVDKETCELRKMYLLPQARGLGIGKQLLERSINYARELGFDRIVLDTASVLQKAIQLYTNYGFVVLEGHPLTARSDQAYVLELSKST